MVSPAQILLLATAAAVLLVGASGFALDPVDWIIVLAFLALAALLINVFLRRCLLVLTPTHLRNGLRETIPHERIRHVAVETSVNGLLPIHAVLVTHDAGSSRLGGTAGTDWAAVERRRVQIRQFVDAHRARHLA